MFEVCLTLREFNSCRNVVASSCILFAVHAQTLGFTAKPLAAAVCCLSVVYVFTLQVNVIISWCVQFSVVSSSLSNVATTAECCTSRPLTGDL